MGANAAAANPSYTKRTGERYHTAGCSACPLCEGRKRVVLYRGSLPCDVLFIGEAPGESEDAIGYPFVGPDGALLAALWGNVTSELPHLDLPSYGITNIVACIPRSKSEYSTGEIRPPSKDEALACRPRLEEILAMANPQLIVLLGDHARRFFAVDKKLGNLAHSLPRWNGKALCLIHPSAILRQESPSAASILEKRFVLSLTEVLKELHG